MIENLDLNELREKLRFAQSVPNVELVLKLIQELEETRAKHRKEWRRAERAEESRLHANVMINTVLEEMGSGPETDPIIKVRQLVARAEVAEAAVQRVRAKHAKRVLVYPNGAEEHYCAAEENSAWPCDTIRALDGGEQE